MSVCASDFISMASKQEYSLMAVLNFFRRALDWRKKLIIAMDAAFGMEYLHLKNIVHFDLKCDNLLVNLGDPQRPVCKVRTYLSNFPYYILTDKFFAYGVDFHGGFSPEEVHVHRHFPKFVFIFKIIHKSPF